MPHPNAHHLSNKEAHFSDHTSTQSVGHLSSPAIQRSHSTSATGSAPQSPIRYGSPSQRPPTPQTSGCQRPPTPQKVSLKGQASCRAPTSCWSPKNGQTPSSTNQISAVESTDMEPRQSSSVVAPRMQMAMYRNSATPQSPLPANWWQGVEVPSPRGSVSSTTRVRSISCTDLSPPISPAVSASSAGVGEGPLLQASVSAPWSKPAPLIQRRSNSVSDSVPSSPLRTQHLCSPKYVPPQLSSQLLAPPLPNARVRSSSVQSRTRPPPFNPVRNDPSSHPSGSPTGRTPSPHRSPAFGSPKRTRSVSDSSFVTNDRCRPGSLCSPPLSPLRGNTPTRNARNPMSPLVHKAPVSLHGQSSSSSCPSSPLRRMPSLTPTHLTIPGKSPNGVTHHTTSHGGSPKLTAGHTLLDMCPVSPLGASCISCGCHLETSEQCLNSLRCGHAFCAECWSSVAQFDEICCPECPAVTGDLLSSSQLSKSPSQEISLKDSFASEGHLSIEEGTIHLTCPGCNNVMDHEGRLALALICGHSFCPECCSKATKGNFVYCPACEFPTDLHGEGMKALHTNYALAGLHGVSFKDMLRQSTTEVLDDVGATCMVCMEAFSPKVEPRVLMCGHTMCSSCCHLSLQACPVCDAPLQELSVNKSMIEFVEALVACKHAAQPTMQVLQVAH